MPLPPFKDEAEFRTAWITPFLTKLGYILVTHAHGQDEQGKDFFFADFDRFDHLRFYAVQAKKGDIGAGDVELNKLLDQVRRAFTVQIRDRKGAEARYVSAVYIFASGKISDRAREYITAWCRQQPYGENVYFLDGERLEQLERHAQYQSDQELRARLHGLRMEAEYNLFVLDEMEKALQAKQYHDPVGRCSNIAIGQALVTPIPLEEFNNSNLRLAWFNNEFTNRYCEHLLTALGSRRAAIINTMRPAVQGTRKLNEELQGQAHAALQKLDQKYAISIETLDTT